MPRPRRLVLILAVLASFALTGTASASAAIVFDAKPGSEAPPATLGPYTMTPFGLDPQAFDFVGGVAGPTGELEVSPTGRFLAGSDLRPAGRMITGQVARISTPCVVLPTSRS